MNTPFRAHAGATLRHGMLAVTLACASWSVLAAVPQATVTPAPTATPGFGARAGFFGDADFVEQEFIVSGLARKFKSSGTLGTDGQWDATVASSDTPYTTMAIVRRPADPARFNGIVIVEWLNVSTGYPLDVDWGMAHEAILRDGYAYVGVNVQKVGIQGVQKLEQFGDRYASGSIPDDDISYDIFSQTAQALRAQTSTLLGKLKPTKIIASGHSQSAMRLTTYANAIQPLDNVYDGILIHGRAGPGARIGQGSTVPSNAFVRADTKVPVFVLQSEMDVTIGPKLSRQPDSTRVRYWEVAGSTHADQYLLDNIAEVSGRDVGWTPPGCSGPYNAMSFYMAENAAFDHLKNWVTAGTPPPVAPRLARDWLGFIKKDANGNAVGGVRLPDIEVPIARYSNSNFTTGSLAFLDLFACVAGGNTTYFKADKLKALYPTHADYVNKVKAAADAAVAKGYIRPADRDSAVQRAQSAAVPQ